MSKSSTIIKKRETTRARESVSHARPVHPGEVLREEFLVPLGLSMNRLAGELKVPTNRLAQIVKGRRAMTPDTAMRLARYFGVGERFWLNLQSSFDLDTARLKNGRLIEREVKPRSTAA